MKAMNKARRTKGMGRLRLVKPEGLTISNFSSFCDSAKLAFGTLIVDSKRVAPHAFGKQFVSMLEAFPVKLDCCGRSRSSFCFYALWELGRVQNSIRVE